ncbi:hypothetical protein AVEN_60954-1 [Araneus ventricosus]|uniref:Uncharacterized protein n=1 Tax=Araneus ventricosus TaxID=182803 RepID=A0A4Y2DCZ1_ARAVE|nr:hypothetical protein AVEN_60954-1 [Araneus ventricosus]
MTHVSEIHGIFRTHAAAWKISLTLSFCGEKAFRTLIRLKIHKEMSKGSTFGHAAGSPQPWKEACKRAVKFAGTETENGDTWEQHLFWKSALHMCDQQFPLAAPAGVCTSMLLRDFEFLSHA